MPAAFEPGDKEGVDDGVCLIRRQAGTRERDDVDVVVAAGHLAQLLAAVPLQGVGRQGARADAEQAQVICDHLVDAAGCGYAFAGLAVQDLDRDTAKELGLKGKMQGVVVTGVEPDSGAEKAGLMAGDVIREINRQPVKSVKDFEKVSSAVKKGENVLILINRRGSSLFLTAKV